MTKVINNYEDILELDGQGEFIVSHMSDEAKMEEKQLELYKAREDLIVSVTSNLYALTDDQSRSIYHHAYMSKHYMGLADVVYYIKELAELYLEINKCA